MAQLTITASQKIAAPAEKIYATIADYQHSHPKILPMPPFIALTVEKGGVGAGTVITFQMKVSGRVQTLRAEVSEPQPGRVLVEKNDNNSVTTFTVEPDGLVTITTTMPIRDGFLGKIEGWFARQYLYPTYVQELKQLERVAQQS